MSFWSGLVEGFQGSREANITRQLELDAARRKTEATVFETLLNSQDQEMQQLALAGLLESASPKKKKGFTGYLGELEKGQYYPKVQARAAEWIPDEEPTAGFGGGPTPPVPGSGAMSTNVPVEAGSQPIQLPGQPLPMEAEPLPQTDYTTGAEAPMPPDQDGLMGGPAAMSMGMPPAPPPISKWKRRGTGVATAKEIAEMQARAPLQARMRMAQQVFAGQPDILARVQQAMFGATPPTNQFEDPTYGVKLPDGTVVPITINRSNGLGQLLDGSPIPPGAQMVRMSGGGTGAGAITTKIPDSARGRQYLLEQGADPNEIAGGSPTGYWKLVTRNDGTVSAQADTFVPPPATSGTTIIQGLDGVPTVYERDRGGGLGAALGPANVNVPGQTERTARGLKTAVDAIMQQERSGGRRVPATRLDEVVRQEAQKLGLPFTTYSELTQGLNQPASSPRQESQGGTRGDQLRAYVLEQMRPQQATPPPAPPGGRSRGVGPGPR